MAIRTDTTNKALEIIARCEGDFWYFLSTYCKVVSKTDAITKRRGVVPFEPWQEQIDVVNALMLNDQVYVLKARQRGLTEITAAYFLWWVMFHPHETHGVIAHEDTAVSEVFSRYLGLYDRLPGFFHKAFPLDNRNRNEIRFSSKHGGYIKVDSEKSAGMVGSTLSSIHFSEFGKYKNADEMLGQLLPTLAEGTKIVYETTAEGFGTPYRYWVTPNGIKKLFFPWTLAKEYIKFEPFDFGRLDNSLANEIRKYANEHNLTELQTNWMAFQLTSRFGNNWRSFHQAYPATPELAFVVSGDRFFDRSFRGPVAQSGLLEFEQPQAQRAYVMGVDTASGAKDGDYSAFVVIDCTDFERPQLVCTFYDRVTPREFVDQVLVAARKYDALVNPETNSYGLSVVDALRQHGDIRLFRDEQRDGTGQIRSSFGWFTSEKTRTILTINLKDIVDQTWFAVPDQRLQLEINSFAYNDKGKPEAQTGQHDDLLIALALALVARGQSKLAEQVRMSVRPKTIEGNLRFYMQNGRNIDDGDVFDDDDYGGYNYLEQLRA